MECFGEIVKHLRPHPRPLPHKEGGVTRHSFMKSDRQLMSMNKRQFSRQIEKGKLVDFDFFF